MLYTAFAIVATLCNILAQVICNYLYSGDFSILISIIMGTGFGLVVKYILDKKYIFQYKTETAGHNRHIFFLYTVMGILTTFIFWGFEFGFHYIFETIHPFQDGNGRVGRLIMFKECLKNNIVPFIIDEDLKMFYYRGLSEWNNEKGYLTDTCLTAQDKYKAYLDYFRIVY